MDVGAAHALLEERVSIDAEDSTLASLKRDGARKHERRRSGGVEDCGTFGGSLEQPDRPTTLSVF